MCRLRLPPSNPPPVGDTMAGIAPTILPSFNLLAWRAQLGEERNFYAELDVRNVYICKCWC